MRSVTQVQTRIGRYLYRSGRRFFIALSKVNRSEKLRGIITYRMKLYAVFFTLLESNEQVDTPRWEIRNGYADS